MDKLLMDKLTVQMSQLIAQRTALCFNFCCHKDNNVNITQKLLTVVRLIQQQHDNTCLISAKNIEQIMVHLVADHNYSDDEVALILSLKLIIEPRLQALLLPVLLKSDQSWIQALSLTIARLLGKQLTFVFDFTQVSNLSQVVAPDELLFHRVLFHLYYQKTLNNYLSDRVPEYANVRDRKLILKQEQNKLSPLTWLYIDVLSDNDFNVAVLTEQFIQQDYLQSTLFELYITSLDEREVTQVVNQLSIDDALIPDIIHAMALSGYAKFIPFIATYLQQSAFVLNAYQALRLLLGDKLDAIIPLSVQFNSDDEERNNDLAYYGAKILNAWQQRLPLLALAFDQEGGENRLLNGITLSAATVEKIFESGSQWHRYVAMLHKQHLATQLPAKENAVVEPYIYDAHALEVC